MQYQAVLGQVTVHGGTETLHKNLARLKSLTCLAQQQKALQQVGTTTLMSCVEKMQEREVN